MNQERSYRATTRAAAEAAYHADARGMVRMGYAPASEDWSTELEQVLTVRYIHAPEQAPAVLQALAEVEAERTMPTERPRRLPGRLLERAASRYSLETLRARLRPRRLPGRLLERAASRYSLETLRAKLRPRRLPGRLLERAASRYSLEPLGAHLLAGGFTGIVGGIALGSSLASSMFGDDPILMVVSTFGLGFIGLFIGLMVSLRD
jgi:hypothetical protein